MSDKFIVLRQLLSGGSTSDMSLFCDYTSDDLIIIGGTRQQTFNLPFSVKLIHKLHIVYTQDNRIILKKTLDDCEVADFDDTLLYFRLSEVETSNFIPGKAYCQLKVLLEDGSILVSAKLESEVVDTLDSRYFNENDTSLCALQINVNNQDTEVVQFFDISASSEDVYRCKFTFDSSWDQFDKFAVFKDEYNHNSYLSGDYVTITDNECKIPAEFIAQPGLLYVGVLGINKNIKKPTDWSDSIRISKSCIYDKYTSSESSSGGGGSGDVPYASETTPGIMKLYQSTGSNDDGAVSQSAITKGFKSVKLVAKETGDPEFVEVAVEFGEE